MCSNTAVKFKMRERKAILPDVFCPESGVCSGANSAIETWLAEELSANYQEQWALTPHFPEQLLRVIRLRGLCGLYSPRSHRSGFFIQSKQEGGIFFARVFERETPGCGSSGDQARTSVFFSPPHTGSCNCLYPGHWGKVSKYAREQPWMEI